MNAHTAIKDQFNRPLRDLRISVTDRCNFRCTYCMPAEIFGEGYRFLPREALLTYEEIYRLARILVGEGVVKLRITGGEPTLRQELDHLIAMLATIDNVEDIAMTTNAYLLPRYAQQFKDAGLQRVTISLDTLDEDVFRQMNGGRASVERVLMGIEAAEAAGLTPIKINAVVQRGVNDHTIVDLARYGKERGWIIRFIEYMDVGTLNGWRMDDVVPASEMLDRINAEMPIEPVPGNYRGEVARRFRYKDGSGEIGVITSVTRPFCGSCSRLRLSAEGELFTCLFGTEGTDLLGPMRGGASDEELATIIRNTWAARTDHYSEQRHALTDTERKSHKVEMYHIGG
jgi:cyclic pyranopterin phosphate synthase